MTRQHLIAMAFTVAITGLLLGSGCEPAPRDPTVRPGVEQTKAAPAEDVAPQGHEPGPRETEGASSGVAKGPTADGLVAQSIADGLMTRWRQANPNVDWEAEERASRTFVPAFDNSALIGSETGSETGSEPGSETGSETGTETGTRTQAEGHSYRRTTEQDVLLWKRETERAVVAGSRVFHSGDELGSTNGVSCDMCHPNAANTHPETYPKFQTQMGRVVLLRDMINWCLINPLRAPAMQADDERMRALEAYIISQRSGEVMAYGKH